MSSPHLMEGGSFISCVSRLEVVFSHGDTVKAMALFEITVNDFSSAELMGMS